MIPVSQPWITSLELRYAREALESGWISSVGRFVDRFEEAFAGYIGVKHAVSTNNGTAACHLAIQTSGLGPESVVVVPALTFVATANAARYCGCKVRIVDINPLSWNATPMAKDLEGASAFFMVHLYGNLCDMDRIRDNCGATMLIEDACEALGGSFKGKMAGTLGRAAAFSFYGNKTISTGEGGMLVTDDDDIAKWARRLRGQGQTERYCHVEVGYNYRMTNIQAAIGLAQIQRIDEIMTEKRRIFERYRMRLAGIVEMQAKVIGTQPSCWAVTIKTPARQRLSEALSHEGVETRPAFIPLPLLLPYKQDNAEVLYPNACSLGRDGVTLPSFPELPNHDVDRICDVVARTIEKT